MNMDISPFFYNADILFKEHHCLKVLSSFPHAFLDSLSKIRFQMWLELCLGLAFDKFDLSVSFYVSTMLFF